MDDQRKSKVEVVPAEPTSEEQPGHGFPPCTCNHAATDHDRLTGRCRRCRCPRYTAEGKMERQAKERDAAKLTAGSARRRWKVERRDVMGQPGTSIVGPLPQHGERLELCDVKELEAAVLVAETLTNAIREHRNSGRMKSKRDKALYDALDGAKL